jgi:FG-GAP-like repeat
VRQLRTSTSENSKLFINVGGRSFRRAPAPWSNGRGQGDRCAEVLDFNGDGWDDLLTCGRAGSTPRLYANQGGSGFADVTPASILGQRLADAEAADLDKDGDPDLVTAAFGEFAYHLNDNGQYGAKAVIASAQGPGRGWAVAVGDADADGDVDVYGMVEQGLYRNADDWIWLNGALEFTSVRVPRAAGAADDVVALRPRRDRRTGFLVLNGRKRFSRGPVQLIRVIRR